MSTNLCLQNRELLGRYSEVLEYLRDLETDLEDYDVSEVRRELVRSEAKLYRLYHELYETIAYQRNHAEAPTHPRRFRRVRGPDEGRFVSGRARADEQGRGKGIP